jgi:hypothetical protein
MIVGLLGDCYQGFIWMGLSRGPTSQAQYKSLDGGRWRGFCRVSKVLAVRVSCRNRVPGSAGVGIGFGLGVERQLG